MFALDKSLIKRDPNKRMLMLVASTGGNAESTDFIKLYRSTLNVNVGPAGNLATLIWREDVWGESVRTSRWVTFRAGAMVR